MNEPAVLCYGLTKAFDSTIAVDGVDLSVERGQVLALLGPAAAARQPSCASLQALRRRTPGSLR